MKYQNKGAILVQIAPLFIQIAPLFIRQPRNQNQSIGGRRVPPKMSSRLRAREDSRERWRLRFARNAAARPSVLKHCVWSAATR